MKKNILIITVIALLAAAFSLNSTARPAQAFSSGFPFKNHHKRITKDALRSIGGFSNAVLNDLADESTAGDRGPAKSKSASHYDNCAWEEGRSWIQSKRDIAVQSAYYYYHTNNPKDRNYALWQLGYVFHAAQDFYSHSNWIETHPWGQIADLEGPKPAGWYSGVCGGTDPKRCPAGTPGHGLPGPICTGMNKDTGACSGFSEARHDAVQATIDQWHRFEAAVRAQHPNEADGIIKKIKGYVDPPPPPTPGPPDPDPPLPKDPPPKPEL